MTKIIVACLVIGLATSTARAYTVDEITERFAMCVAWAGEALMRNPTDPVPQRHFVRDKTTCERQKEQELQAHRLENYQKWLHGGQ
jgi:hypothetical protein